MRPPRIEITIDRLVVDRPGLTREALAAALEAEVERRLARGGIEAFGSGGAFESRRARVPGGSRPLAERVAVAIAATFAAPFPIASSAVPQRAPGPSPNGGQAHEAGAIPQER